MLLGGGQNEDGVGRRFLKGFEEGIEGGLREHMHLIDDEHAVFTIDWRNLHLIGEGADVIDRVI